jgi:hypothetical protein
MLRKTEMTEYTLLHIYKQQKNCNKLQMIIINTKHFTYKK